jgi:hypothetical protein
MANSTNAGASMISLHFDVERFYKLLSQLERIPGQGAPLFEALRSKAIAKQGVYFFREAGELRADGGAQRIVRVGTHGVTSGSKATLRSRLRAHLGTRAGSGNHRGSIFRLHVGMAMLRKTGVSIPTWGVGKQPPPQLKADPVAREAEAKWEAMVSKRIGSMGALWVDVPDESGLLSVRGFIERNAIALLSNRGRPLDPASPEWLGKHSPRGDIVSSHLWNIKHVNEVYDPSFLDALADAVNRAIQKN